VIFIIDAQLPPALAGWLGEFFNIRAQSIMYSELKSAPDFEIFQAFRDSGCVIISKDFDFVDLVTRFDVPPQILWLTCGNLTNRFLRELFQTKFAEALTLLSQGTPVVEFG
jgi:predicted nuclease of predicted toxin-antitoxin system